MLETFPVVRERLKATRRVDVGRRAADARAVEGGHARPEILLVDELSLGLAPLVVQQLLEVVERLKAQGSRWWSSSSP